MSQMVKYCHYSGSGVITIIRAKKVYFQTSKRDLARLYQCNRDAATVWNTCLELSRDHYKATGKWINESELHHATKKNDSHYIVNRYRLFIRNI